MCVYIYVIYIYVYKTKECSRPSMLIGLQPTYFACICSHQASELLIITVAPAVGRDSEPVLLSLCNTCQQIGGTCVYHVLGSRSCNSILCHRAPPDTGAV